MSFLDALATPVATVLKGIHAGLSTFLAPSSGPAWGLSIVLLTISVRLLLFPLFVKQIKSQRRMQELSPKIKELQTKHKGDRETLNTELMKLYKDHGANPISGCLPLILQLPVFFALFRTMNEFRPKKGDIPFPPKFGLSSELLQQGAHAKVFGAPISAAFNSSADFLRLLGGSSGTVRVVAATMIVIMGASTFYTQRQMMARNAPGDAQQAQIQKILLYVLPLSFAFFGFSFPIGVLLYWLTTNLWSMGQQAWVIKRMPPVVAGGATPPRGGTVVSAKGPRGGGPKDSAPKAGAPKGGAPVEPNQVANSPAGSVITAAPAGMGTAPVGAVSTASGSGTVTGGSQPSSAVAARSVDRRPQGSRKRKGGASRRGGRR